MGQSNKVVVKVGDVVRVELPYSEVCMYMRVAGKTMLVRVLDERNGALLLNDDGSDFCAPILHGEAGIYTFHGADWYTYGELVDPAVAPAEQAR